MAVTAGVRNWRARTPVPSESEGCAAPIAARVAKASMPTVSATQNDEYPSSTAREAARRPAWGPSAEKLANVTPMGFADDWLSLVDDWLSLMVADATTGE
jgi:hypothetical protein